jgi:OOP family OmpA-OmpF porin
MTKHLPKPISHRLGLVSLAMGAALLTGVAGAATDETTSSDKKGDQVTRFAEGSGAGAVQYSPGYQYDMNGNVVRGADGNCLRTSKWGPDNALSACDPDAVAQYDKDIPKPKFARVVGVKPVTAVINLLADKNFAFNSSKLSAQGKEAIAAAVEANKDNYIYRISIVGYTDRIGRLNYNMKLSEKRAAAVKAAFIAAGVPEERIYTEGRGPADPLVACEGENGYPLIRCLAPNRRVVIGITIPEVIADDLEAEYIRTRKAKDAPEVKAQDIVEKAPVVDTGMVAPVIASSLKSVGDACSKEINTFCTSVPLGEFRVYDCLKAHEGELSESCATAMVAGRSAVEKALGDVNFFGAQCGPDMKDRCPEVEIGSGEVLSCLKTKINTVTRRCVDAMLEVGLLANDPFGRTK